VSLRDELTGPLFYAYMHPRSPHAWTARFIERPFQQFAQGDDRPAWAKPATYDTRRQHGPAADVLTTSLDALDLVQSLDQRFPAPTGGTSP
jgi:hypothetical protein